MATPLRQPRAACLVARRAARRTGAMRAVTRERRVGLVAVARRALLRAARDPTALGARPPCRRPWRTPGRVAREPVAVARPKWRRTERRIPVALPPVARRVAALRRVALVALLGRVPPVGVARMLRRRTVAPRPVVAPLVAPARRAVALRLVAVRARPERIRLRRDQRGPGLRLLYATAPVATRAAPSPVAPAAAGPAMCASVARPPTALAAVPWTVTRRSECRLGSAASRSARSTARPSGSGWAGSERGWPISGVGGALVVSVIGAPLS